MPKRSEQIHHMLEPPDGVGGPPALEQRPSEPAWQTSSEDMTPRNRGNSIRPRAAEPGAGVALVGGEATE